MTLIIRMVTHARAADDIEINPHTNETLASLRRTILRRIKSKNVYVVYSVLIGFPILVYSGKLELSISGGEGREPFVLNEDKKLLGQFQIRDKMIITAKLCPTGSTAASSPDSSSDSSTSCAPHGFDTPGAAEEIEQALPGVVIFSTSP